MSAVAYQIARFRLKELDGEREVELVRKSPVIEGLAPAVGDILEVHHHGAPFRARVVWRSAKRNGLVRLRVDEL